MDDLQNDLLPKDFQSFASDPVLVKTLPLAAAMPAPLATDEAKSLLEDLGAALDGDALVATSFTADAPAPAVDNKTKIIVKALRAIEQNVSNLLRLLEDETGVATLDTSGITLDREVELASVRPVDGRVVEGVFDGQQMVGSDGKVYAVPPNYASKSKLVEGDMLKLTITPRGSFIYKQIGPIERGRVVGALGFDQTTGEFYVTSDNKRWSVIKASVTYYKGEHGDEAVILVPKAAPSKWAAVENIIKKNPL